MQYDLRRHNIFLHWYIGTAGTNFTLFFLKITTATTTAGRQRKIRAMFGVSEEYDQYEEKTVIQKKALRKKKLSVGK